MTDTDTAPQNPDSRKPTGAASVRRFRPASRRWLVGIGIGVLMVGGILLLRPRGARGESPRERSRQSPPPVPVSTVVVRKGDIGVFVSALGTVTPVYTVAVKSRVDGQLMAVNYQEGQMVHTGEALAEIDPRPYQALLAQAEGQLARDKALLENAKIDLDRYQAAYARNAIAKQTLDTQGATLHQYEGSVKFDQGQVDNAKVQLAYCHLTAPITGRVGLRLVDPGNIVHSSDTNPLVVITQLQPITVIFSVAEDDLPRIVHQLNLGKQLEVDAFDRAQEKRIATGKLLTLDNQVDPGTGTVRLKAIFSNEDDSLFPSQFVNVKLRVDTQQGATLVPVAAVQRNAQGSFVYVVKPDQTAAMHTVTVGTTDETNAAVAGLEPGAIIVADNFNRLQDGARVTSRKPGEIAKRKTES